MKQEAIGRTAMKFWIYVGSSADRLCG